MGMMVTEGGKDGEEVGLESMEDLLDKLVRLARSGDHFLWKVEMKASLLGEIWVEVVAGLD